MNTNTYPRWVGVILGLFLNGSAHFLAGKRAAGIRWYLAITFTSLAAILTLTLPGVFLFYFSIAVFLLSILLWLIMLKQSFQPVRRIGIRGWIAVLLLTFVLGLGMNMVSKQVIQTFKVPTVGMSPTIVPGDCLVAERVSYWFGKPKRGDVIVFSTSGLNHPNVRRDVYYIKRIVGLPGETVQIDPPNLLIDGKIIMDPIIFKELSSHSSGFTLAQGKYALLSTREDKIILGNNEYLTLGDNSGNSLDGRYYGAISEDKIVGRVSRIYWPISRIGK